MIETRDKRTRLQRPRAAWYLTGMGLLTLLFLGACATTDPNLDYVSYEPFCRQPLSDHGVGIIPYDPYYYHMQPRAASGPHDLPGRTYSMTP